MTCSRNPSSEYHTLHWVWPRKHILCQKSSQVRFYSFPKAREYFQPACLGSSLGEVAKQPEGKGAREKPELQAWTGLKSQVPPAEFIANEEEGLLCSWSELGSSKLLKLFRCFSSMPPQVKPEPSQNSPIPKPEFDPIFIPEWKERINSRKPFSDLYMCPIAQEHTHTLTHSMPFKHLSFNKLALLLGKLVTSRECLYFPGFCSLFPTETTYRTHFVFSWFPLICCHYYFHVYSLTVPKEWETQIKSRLSLLEDG